MRAQPLYIKLVALILAAVVSACSSASQNATLAAGMTPSQTIEVMGQPDLKDSIPDPNNSGGNVLRYVWLEPGKVAVFGPNDRLANVQQIEPAEKTQAELEARTKEIEPPFTLETPFNYAFFPIKAAFIYIGAGLNCVGGGGCQKPRLPSPSHS